ncbi:MAG: NAD(P)-dependent alcohol dehydrogenase [Bifidobacteriaceae bacterium]|jgi:NADPH:quinone reductase-like Zn-dependent oxidoreductase|nr:NAD(P)-dependent alcohol dehydrogenase [Bifidobacteriaceae bacterium]
MKAQVYSRYGGPDQLRLAEVARPRARPDGVLVRVEAASLNAYDWRLLRGDPAAVRLLQGLFRPKNQVLGSDMAGTVAAVGADVGSLKVGDQVFGSSGASWTGGLAEFAAARAAGLAVKPANLSFEQAAALPMAGVTALAAVREVVGVKDGMDVLVNGAAGGVGTFAVQLAKALGARVTGVCGANHAELVRGIGADRVVDYAKEDFTAAGEAYDGIVDVAANRSVAELRRALKPGGVIASVGFGGVGHTAAVGLAAARKRAPKRVALVAADNKDGRLLRDLLALVEAGAVRPVIDRVYPFEQAAQAFAHIGRGHAGGKVVIRVG